MQPRQLVHAWVDAFNRGDVEALAAFYTEDAINHQVAESPVEGREAIHRMFANGFAAATMICIVENVFEDGEWAILEWRDPRGLRAVASFTSSPGGSCSSVVTGTSCRFCGPRGCRCPTNRELIGALSEF